MTERPTNGNDEDAEVQAQLDAWTEDRDYERAVWLEKHAPDNVVPIQGRQRRSGSTKSPNAPAAQTSARTPDPFDVGSETEIARRLLSRLKKDGHKPIFDEGALWTYGGAEAGTWRTVEESAQSRIVQTFDGALVGKRPLKINRHTVVGASRLAGDLAASPGFFAKARLGLAFRDGFLSVTDEGLKLVEHSHEHGCRAGYDHDYDEAAEPVQFLKFLDDIFRDDADKDQRIEHVQELGGAAALGIGTRYHKSAIWVSPGGGGRTQLGEIIAAAMPAGSVVGIKPQMFTNANRRALLVNKRANIVDETPKAAMVEADWFKQLVDGNRTDAEYKYGHPFYFTPIALHIFLANELPAAECSDAFFRRVVVLRFSRQFHKDGTEVAELAKKIIAAELPAIVCWFMRGADRLIRQGGYTVPESHHATAREWRQQSDTVAMFVVERCVLCDGEKPTADNEWAQATTLYKHYKDWAERTGHKPVAHNTFGQRMTALELGSVSDGVGRFHPVRIRKRAVLGDPKKNIPADPGDSKRADALTELEGRKREQAQEKKRRLTDLTNSLQTSGPSLSAQSSKKTNTSNSPDRLDGLSGKSPIGGPAEITQHAAEITQEKVDAPKVRQVRQSKRNGADGHAKALTDQPKRAVGSVSDTRGRR